MDFRHHFLPALLIGGIAATSTTVVEAAAVPTQSVATDSLNPHQRALLARLRARPTTRSVSIMQAGIATLSDAANTVRQQQMLEGGRILWEGVIGPGGTLPDEPPRRRMPDRTGWQVMAVPAASRTVQTIDILVAYTSEAKRWAADGDIARVITSAEQRTNRSFRNSGIAATVHVIATLEVSYDERARDFEDMVDDLAGVNGDVMKDVRDRGDAIGADIAVLLVDRPEARYCGIAYDVLVDSEHAFAVSDQSCAWETYTFAHEIGHLVGARHDMANDPAQPFEYGHGLQYPAGGGLGWRTIMAYRCEPGLPQCDERLPYWSNPSMRFGTAPTGTTEYQNNARVWRERARFVAGFRTRPANTPF
jgi:hypothetical protein